MRLEEPQADREDDERRSLESGILRNAYLEIREAAALLSIFPSSVFADVKRRLPNVVLAIELQGTVNANCYCQLCFNKRNNTLTVAGSVHAKKGPT